jgi:predicted ATPase
MELQEIKITNYKSLVDLEIKNPNPFTVFAGPNGAGKSNIFEALEFASYNERVDNHEVLKMFGGIDKIVNFNTQKRDFSMEIQFPSHKNSIVYLDDDKDYKKDLKYFGPKISSNFFEDPESKNIITRQGNLKQFLFYFIRLFINKSELNRIRYDSSQRILPDASNTASVLKNILQNPNKKEEFLDWVQLFVPGLSNIEVHTDSIEGNDSLLIFEKGTNKPFTKSLISDGTYNILALLTAVYQVDEPQFLCIEEPENGLNPFVVESLVSFFRQQCEEKGHYIWLNTHSQTLVKHLRPQELILVDKKEGATTIKQFPADYNLHGLDMDEAWLSNALGGGVPW